MNKIDTVSSRQIIETLYENGTYPRLKQLYKHIDLIKEQFKKRLETTENNKRLEFFGKKVIAKWRKREMYHIEEEKLNEFLHDRGLLIPCVYISNKGTPTELLDAFKPFISDKKIHITIHPNKNGRISIPQGPIYQDINNESLALSFYELKKEKDEYQKIYDSSRKLMEQCPDLQQNKYVKHKYGSIKLTESISGYNINAIVKNFGIDGLIKYGKVKWDMVEYFMKKQIINKSEIMRFKKMVDIRTDFILTTKEDEESQWKYFQSRFEFL